MSRIIKSPAISRHAYHVPEAERTKNAQASAPSQSAVEKIDPEVLVRQMIEQAEKQAGEILEQAKSEAERLQVEAHSEAERIKASAREEGRREGQQQGRREIEQQMNAQAIAFERSVLALQEAFQRDKERLVRKSEPQLIDLACAIAGRIVRKEIAQDDETVLRIVQKAVDLATEKERLVIRLNPEDLEWVRRHCEQLRNSHDDIGEIHFEKDPRIERGGCIVETASGNVDARLDQQIEGLQRDLQENL